MFGWSRNILRYFFPETKYTTKFRISRKRKSLFRDHSIECSPLNKEMCRRKGLPKCYPVHRFFCFQVSLCQTGTPGSESLPLHQNLNKEILFHSCRAGLEAGLEEGEVGIIAPYSAQFKHLKVTPPPPPCTLLFSDEGKCPPVPAE